MTIVGRLILVLGVVAFVSLYLYDLPRGPGAS